MSAEAVRAFESVCGPWYLGDLPSDIVADIRGVDPDAEVTEADAQAYLDELTDEAPSAPDIWAMLEEDAPAGCAAVQDLYSWSLNFDSGKGPFALFLDIIGWSEENLGEAIYNTSKPVIGYLEAAKLGAALVEYADRPHDVMAYAEALIAAEPR